jgi:large-conductance mechanosensitive channel
VHEKKHFKTAEYLSFSFQNHWGKGIHMKKRISAVLGTVMLAVLLMACGSGTASKTAVQNTGTGVYEAQNDTTDSAAGSSGQAAGVTSASGQKLVRTVDMTVELDSSDRITETADSFTAKAKELGGYVAENSVQDDEYGTSTHLTLKVPDTQADALLSFARTTGKIRSLNDNVEDVTLRYTDMDTRIKTLKTEQERLAGYLEKAQSVSEMKEIEDSLQDVTERLEQAESDMRVLSSQISYTEISITIEASDNEMVRSTARFRQAWNSIGKNIIDSTSVLIVIISYLLPFVIVAVIIILIVNAIGKRKKPKQQTENMQAAAPGQTYAAPQYTMPGQPMMGAQIPGQQASGRQTAAEVPGQQTPEQQAAGKQTPGQKTDEK